MDIDTLLGLKDRFMHSGAYGLYNKIISSGPVNWYQRYGQFAIDIPLAIADISISHNKLAAILGQSFDFATAFALRKQHGVFPFIAPSIAYVAGRSLGYLISGHRYKEDEDKGLGYKVNQAVNAFKGHDAGHWGRDQTFAGGDFIPGHSFVGNAFKDVAEFSSLLLGELGAATRVTPLLSKVKDISKVYGPSIKYLPQQIKWGVKDTLSDTSRFLRRGTNYFKNKKALQIQWGQLESFVKPLVDLSYQKPDVLEFTTALKKNYGLKTLEHPNFDLEEEYFLPGHGHTLFDPANLKTGKVVSTVPDPLAMFKRGVDIFDPAVVAEIKATDIHELLEGYTVPRHVGSFAGKYGHAHPEVPTGEGLFAALTGSYTKEEFHTAMGARSDYKYMHEGYMHGLGMLERNKAYNPIKGHPKGPWGREWTTRTLNKLFPGRSGFTPGHSWTGELFNERRELLGKSIIKGLERVISFSEAIAAKGDLYLSNIKKANALKPYWSTIDKSVSEMLGVVGEAKGAKQVFNVLKEKRGLVIAKYPSEAMPKSLFTQTLGGRTFVFPKTNRVISVVVDPDYIVAEEKRIEAKWSKGNVNLEKLFNVETPGLLRNKELKDIEHSLIGPHELFEGENVFKTYNKEYHLAHGHFSPFVPISHASFAAQSGWVTKEEFTKMYQEHSAWSEYQLGWQHGEELLRLKALKLNKAANPSKINNFFNKVLKRNKPYNPIKAQTPSWGRKEVADTIGSDYTAGESWIESAVKAGVSWEKITEATFVTRGLLGKEGASGFAKLLEQTYATSGLKGITQQIREASNIRVGERSYVLGRELTPGDFKQTRLAFGADSGAVAGEKFVYAESLPGLSASGKAVSTPFLRAGASGAYAGKYSMENTKNFIEKYKTSMQEHMARYADHPLGGEIAAQRMAREKYGSMVPDIVGTTKTGFLQEYAGESLIPAKVSKTHPILTQSEVARNKILVRAGNRSAYKMMQDTMDKIMETSGVRLVHFDLHRGNILRRGTHLSVIDWGLAAPMAVTPELQATGKDMMAFYVKKQLARVGLTDLKGVIPKAFGPSPMDQITHAQGLIDELSKKTVLTRLQETQNAQEAERVLRQQSMQPEGSTKPQGKIVAPSAQAVPWKQNQQRHMSNGVDRSSRKR